MLDVAATVDEYFEEVAAGRIEIYNEPSLQYELGIFLRAATSPTRYKVQFERPVGFFGFPR